jgi:hypothetical protein
MEYADSVLCVLLVGEDAQEIQNKNVTGIDKNRKRL